MKSWPSLSLGLVTLTTALVSPTDSNIKDFDWTALKPSTSLNYTSCYDGLKCARLQVPLDWLDESNDERVTLAVIAQPAVVNEDDESFGGSIIVNPGGPGGSGVDFIRSGGKLIQKTADDNKKYEIVSFDPRGIGHTEPIADCFHDEFVRGEEQIEGRAVGPLDQSIDVVRRELARAHGMGKLCQRDANDENDIRGFVTTSSVARDIVEIVDKLHELRGERDPSTKLGALGSNDGEADRDDGNRLELRSESGSISADDTPRVMYWGFSYGTVLGNYLASMFPGRIGRIIIEAVEDVHDYKSGDWATNLVDTQKCLDHLWDTCYEGGSTCSLFKPSDSSPNDIRDRVRVFMDELEQQPKSYVTGNSFVSILKHDIQNLMLGPLYQPQRDFERLANILSDAMSGNFTSVYESLNRPKPSENCPLKGSGEPDYKYTWQVDAQRAIACGDAYSQRHMTAEGIADHVRNLTADAPDFGAEWSQVRVGCTGWRFRPKYSFAGPWKTPKADPKLTKGKPAAPMLIVSSRYDPVTPLVNARETSKQHPGSTVLIQENVGHGSLISPGKCREKIIKKYFETGELPGGEIVCEADCQPFKDCPRFERGWALSVEPQGREMRHRKGPLEMF